MLSIFLQNGDAEQMIDMEREDRETGRERQAKKKKEAWEGEASDNIGARAEDYIAPRKLWDNFEKKNRVSAWQVIILRRVQRI